MINQVDALFQWAAHEDTQIECLSVGGKQVVVSPKGDKPSFFRRLLGNLFECLNSELNRYAGLKDVLKNVAQSYKPEDAEKLKKIFERIKREFLKVQKEENVESAVQANDLLEVYNSLFQERTFSDLNLQRIDVNELTVQGKQTPEISEKDVLLVEYKKIAQFIQEAQTLKQKQGPLTGEEVKSLCEKQVLKKANVLRGKIIDLLYRHKFVGRHELEKIITKVEAWRFGSSRKVTSVRRTVKFFKNLHIDLWLDVGGKLYSFSEVFGYSVREPKSFQESFTRPITDQMKDLLLVPFMEARSKVREELSDEHAQIICSNAFAQNTILDCPAGTIDTPRTIRGKIISESPDEQEEIGYQGKAPFTLHDLFGGYAPLGSCTTKTQAQEALLGAMASFINKHDTFAVIQRLTPSDIHHYFATADAKVLSREECCKVLKDEFKGDIKFFENDASSTINIAGSTLSSVSIPAIRREPAILATNDRKVMMVQHADQSLASFHVFIAATSIANIGVTVPPGDVEVGKDFGWMGYGSEAKHAWIRAKPGQMTHIPAQSLISWPWKMVLSVLNFLRGAFFQQRSGVEVSSSAPEATFAPGGSTVVSIYPKSDYMLTEQVKKATDMAVRNMPGQLPELLEIQSPFGAILATPVTYQTVKLMKSLTVEILPQNPLKTLQAFHQKLLTLKKPSSLEQTWKRILDKALQAEGIFQNVTGDDRYMLEKLHTAIKIRTPPSERSSLDAHFNLSGA